MTDSSNPNRTPKQTERPPMPDNYYSEIGTNVRVTDDISFKLLGLVPLVSGSGILAILFQGEALWSPAIYFIALIGALVTFGLFRWELRNIQTCEWLRQRAADIESRTALVQEHGIGHFLNRESAPAILGVEVGKTEAEKLIYTVT